MAVRGGHNAPHKIVARIKYEYIQLFLFCVFFRYIISFYLEDGAHTHILVRLSSNPQPSDNNASTAATMMDYIFIYTYGCDSTCVSESKGTNISTSIVSSYVITNWPPWGVGELMQTEEICSRARSTYESDVRATIHEYEYIYDITVVPCCIFLFLLLL